MGAPTKIQELVERFPNEKDELNETQVRQAYIDPLFEALGWDVASKKRSQQAFREVVLEDSIRVEGAKKAPDYGFYVAGARCFFVEAKDPSVNISTKKESAFQLRRYGWSAGLPLSILTDFEEFAVYDCRVQPEEGDKANTARIEYFKFDHYDEHWERIESLFSKEAVRDGSLDAFTTGKKKGTQPVDKALLKEIETWRAALAIELHQRNSTLDRYELNYAVQATIDRIVFLRVCEDRGVEEYGRLQELLEDTGVYRRLCNLFREADERYNSGLFHFRSEPSRGEPEDWTLGLAIGDETLKRVIESLYYPKSPYQFSVMPVEILGQTYEQFLGSVIRIEDDSTGGSSDGVVIEEKPEVKKAGGVYYTPSYIVDYIVENTVGKLVEGKTPKQVSDLKLVDPACGSGSFLIGAYDYLLNWHLQWYVENSPAKHKKAVFEHKYLTDEGTATEWRLTASKKRDILLNNIHGVDIDFQAVEVTKLSLLLKVLEGETSETVNSQPSFFRERALPDLEKNIRSGNSLIGSDYYDTQQISLLDQDERRRINVFDWAGEEGFPGIFSEATSRSPGFDAVIGNPPYIFTRELLSEVEREYFSTEYHTSWEKQNTYMLFMELMFRIVNKGGTGSYIVPNSWLTVESARLLRALFVPRLKLIADLNYAVFDRVGMEPCIFVVSNDKSASRVSVVRAESKNEFFEANPTQFERNRWTSPNWRIVFSASAEAFQVLDKIIENSKCLSDIFDVRSGLQAYERGRGIPPQMAEDVKQHVFDRKTPENEHSVPYLGGSDVGRYYLQWSGLWMQYGVWLSQPREFEIFSRPRVLLREITSGPPYCFNAVYVEDDYLNNKSVLNVLSEHDDCRDLKCLLGILNSRLTSLYYRQRAVKSNRTIFPKVVIKNLREFPYPAVIQGSVQNDLVQQVEQMMLLHEQLSQAKVPADRTSLQGQIKNTDEKIDRLVYELYSLTDDEIEIVEGSQATY